MGWTVWRERNRRGFENVEISVNWLKEMIFQTLFFRCDESNPSGVNPFVEFMDSISVC